MFSDQQLGILNLHLQMRVHQSFQEIMADQKVFDLSASITKYLTQNQTLFMS
jgi:hypothetical protein